MQTFDVVVEQIIKRTRTVRVQALDPEVAEEMAAIIAEETPWPSAGIAMLKQTFEVEPYVAPVDRTRS